MEWKVTKVKDKDTAIRLATKTGYPSYWAHRDNEIVFVQLNKY